MNKWTSVEKELPPLDEWVELVLDQCMHPQERAFYVLMGVEHKPSIALGKFHGFDEEGYPTWRSNKPATPWGGNILDATHITHWRPRDLKLPVYTVRLKCHVCGEDTSVFKNSYGFCGNCEANIRVYDPEFSDEKDPCQVCGETLVIDWRIMLNQKPYIFCPVCNPPADDYKM